MHFFDLLEQKAVQLQRKLVFPESNDARVLAAVRQIKDESIAVPILLGKPEEVTSLAKKNNVNLDDIEIIDHVQSPLFDEFSSEFYKLRKAKGITESEAAETMKKPTYFATMLVQKGMAHGSISGSTCTTAETLRPAFQIIGTQRGVLKASGVFLMLKEEENELFLFADAAVNADPTAEELVGIALSTAETAREFGLEPRLAMLSFSTYGSAQHPHVEKVREATSFLHKRKPELIVGGEMQFDAAFSPEVAKQKCPDSPIQGNANVFIFPDLDSGNIAYKMTQRLGKFMAIGPIIQGLKKPVNDLSRGCSVEDIVDMAICTATQLQYA